MTLVIDASVAAKWYLDEAGSQEAQAIARGNEPLIAPDLVLVEVASVIWRKVRVGQIGAATLGMVPFHLPGVFRDLTPIADLLAAATDLAAAYDHPVYDCLYVALAQRSSSPLVTADMRLVRRFSQISERIRILPLNAASGERDPNIPQ